MVFENSFKGKAALVTGAGRGIGKAVAQKLHALGATVWAVSRNPNNLLTLELECPGIQTVTVDLGDWKATKEAIEKIPIVFDCLVNNAGICNGGGFMDITEEDFDATTNVNLKAVVNVTQVVAKKMIEKGCPGSIVNVSSVDGLKAYPGLAIYSTLKAGLEQLSKIMAIELGPHKIRVNCVNPGCVDTDLLTSLMGDISQHVDMAAYEKRIPLRRTMIEMDEVVNGILFYLSDLVPILTGTSLPIDGGYIIT